MLNRARIEASNRRIALLRTRRFLRGFALAAGAVGASAAEAANALGRFSEAIWAAVLFGKPRYVPRWLWIRWQRLKSYIGEYV